MLTYCAATTGSQFCLGHKHTYLSGRHPNTPPRVPGLATARHLHQRLVLPQPPAPSLPLKNKMSTFAYTEAQRGKARRLTLLQQHPSHVAGKVILLKCCFDKRKLNSRNGLVF
ncbi:hypothetical protein E2C01_050054 [Portunus trituberculatus]|uniref:Uncharacterized protein n=1 Tax=Portunus trituberculatus TaxID=210409 RepID=A0A5B7G7Y7_PORTR|nr:hypothetical protein [Portunus trituberculatus]